MITLQHYLLVSALLFCIGLFAILTRKNAVAVLMGIELVLNAGNLNLLAFARFTAGNLRGQVFAAFVILIAAAEAAIALAIVLNIYHRFHTINVPEVDELKN